MSDPTMVFVAAPTASELEVRVNFGLLTLLSWRWRLHTESP